MASKRATPPIRNRYFTAVNSCSARTVADRHRLVAYHNLSTADELPEVPTSVTLNMTLNPTAVLVIFFVISGCDAY